MNTKQGKSLQNKYETIQALLDLKGLGKWLIDKLKQT